MSNNTIYFIGDSITRGVTLVDGKYKIIDESFYEKFKNIIYKKTKNFGKFGITTKKFLENINKYTGKDVDLIFFQMGGNDCNFNWKEIAKNPDAIHYPNVSKVEYESNLRKIYDYFYKNKIKAITLNLPPLHPEKFFNYLGNKKEKENILRWLKNISKIYYHHESYNKIFERVTYECGLNMIDIRSDFLKEDILDDLISEDGIHPTKLGHELIFKSINEYLVKTFIYSK